MGSIGFVCCTPYHVILAVYLSLGKMYTKEEKDIYICNHFIGAKSVYDVLKTMNLFKGVYYIEDKENNYGKNKIKKYIRMFRRDIKAYDIPLKAYRIIHIYSYTYFSIIFSQLQKEQFGTTVVMVEDGLMTYMLNKNSHNLIFWRLMNRMPFLKKRYFTAETINEIFLFRPELNVGNYACAIKRIPKMDKCEELLSYLNKIFQYTSITQEISDYIIFTQPLPKRIQNKLEAVSLYIVNSLGKSIMYKVHPREKVENYKVKVHGTVLETHAPWELIYMNEREKFKHCTLISVHSTAVFSPMIMFRDDIHILLLNQLLGESNEQLELFVANFSRQSQLKHFKVLDKLVDIQLFEKLKSR